MSSSSIHKLDIPKARLRVGLLLDSLEAPVWVHQVIKQLLRSEHVEVKALLLNPSHLHRHHSRGERLLRRWIHLNKRLSWKGSGQLAPETRHYNLPSIIISAAGSHSRLQSCELDLIINLGSGEAAQRFSCYARFGLWTFQYPRYRTDTAELAMLYSMMDREKTCELALRVNRADREMVLFQGSYRVHPLSLPWNLSMDATRRAHILMRALTQFAGRRFQPADCGTNPVRAEERYPAPSLPQMGGYLTRWAWDALGHVAARFWYRQEWCIALYRPNAASRKQDDFVMLWSEQGYNCADPFLFEKDGKTYLFFEKWPTGGRGSLWCAELNEDGVAGESREVLARDHHMSYPFVFLWDGNIYLLPESWDNQTIEIYRATAFPWQWEPAGVLIDSPGVDSTLVEHEGRLWMFSAGVGGAKETETTELSVFYADSPFGPWQAHPNNPVVCNVSSARPAGCLFRHKGQLYRPAQDGSVEYGYAMTLNRVDMLSPTEYHETPIASILPNWIPGIHGTHTVNQTAQWGALDARVRFSRLHWKRREQRVRATAAARFRELIGQAETSLGKGRTAVPQPGRLKGPQAERQTA